MERGTLAEQVLQKLKQKRQLQQKNRPPNDVLKLQAIFTRQLNALLKEQYSQLQKRLKQQEQIFLMIEEHTQELDNTGKKNFPRIIIRPAFIASQKVSEKVKQFYLKLANTFLRVQILRSRSHQQSEKQEQIFMKEISQVGQLEKQFRERQDQIRKITNAKRLKVLKQALRLQQLKADIESIKTEIKKEREERLDLVEEYELKKLNIGNRLNRLKKVEEQIQMYKDKIEQLYNPIVYREHLKTIFQHQTKNEMLLKSLTDVRRRVKTLQTLTQKQQKSLSKSQLADKIGKIPLGMGPRRKNRNTHCYTYSSSISKNASKIKQNKHTISMYCTQTEPIQKSKQFQKHKQPSSHALSGCSLFGSMGSTDLVSLPRYRSAFSKRFNNC